jgi:bifunctional enzyme CysN/CysC
MSTGFFEMDLLRLSTAGSVDDGKSTLIGRLLYDSKAIFEDQLEAVDRASERLGEAERNLALLTDGLRAEREQKITIDVAYRFFATPRRKFIMADTPGHLQYTRNMVTGASTADLTIILIDAQKGLLDQSRRHAVIASLLQIPHVVVAVNKMDLVEWSQEVFDAICRDFRALAQRLQVRSLSFVPMSALKGDNVVHRSESMPWHTGPTLLHLLENVQVGSRRNAVDFRLPVQCVLRPHSGFRACAGRIASGSIRPGEEVMALPGGQVSRVRSITVFEGELPQARAGQSVAIELEDDIDAGRGAMLVRPGNQPPAVTRIQAALCWMSGAPLTVGRSMLLMHCGQTVTAQVESLDYRLDISRVRRESAESLSLNEIGRCALTLSAPIFADPYALNTETGSFILIDPATNDTAAAGMVLRPLAPAALSRPLGAVWQPLNIPREEREADQGHAAACLWLTGLSGAGKTTLARALERRLYEQGISAMLLDGDHLRHGLCADLGFTDADRRENIRRIAQAARIAFDHGHIVLCAAISPFAADRAAAREAFPAGRFIEIHVDVSLAAAEARDPKGLYAKARSGQIMNFTGLTSPYEAPENPEIRVDSEAGSVEQSVEAVLAALVAGGLIPEA